MQKMGLVLGLALAACSQIVDFDRSKIYESEDDVDGGAGDGTTGRGDAGMDASGGPAMDAQVGKPDGGDAGPACDVNTHDGCEPTELCCVDEMGARCVPATAETGCEACGVACDLALAGTCTNRTCECEPNSGEGCNATGAQPICERQVCVECTEPAHCDGNPDGEACVDNECVECDPDASTCSGSTPICDDASYECEPCTPSPNNCTGGLECSTAFGCVGCDPDDDSGCGGGTPQCKPGTLQCVQCLDSTHCSGRTPICDTVSSGCNKCANNAQCSAKTPGTVCVTTGTQDGACAECDPQDHEGCSGGTPRCEPTALDCVQCLTSADCSGTEPICNQTTHQCEPCVSNAQCNAKAPGSVCAMQGAQLGACGGCDPMDDDGCGGATPQCSQASLTCVECLTSADCAGTEPVCNPSTFRCEACDTNAECNAKTAGTVCVTAGVRDGACGTCDPTDHEGCSAGTQCDPGTYTCVDCVNDGGCSGVDDQCNTAAQQCVDCDASGGCPAGAQCDLDTNTCVDCLNDTGCSGTNDQCNTATNTCVDCDATGGCAVGEQCDLGSSVCVDCIDDSGCSGTNDQCDTSTNACVDCQGGDGCIGNTVCKTSGNTCVECNGSGDCFATPGTPVCNTLTNECVGCLGNADCAATNEACVLGSCQPCASDGECTGHPSGGQCVDVGGGTMQCRACDPADNAGCAGLTPTCGVSFVCG